MSEPAPVKPSTADSVARAGSIMVVSLALSRILGLLRDTVIASQFGLGLENDTYRIAIQLPDLVFMLIAGGGLSSAFIPVFAEYWHTERREQAWKTFSAVVTLTFCVGLAVVALVWAYAPGIIAFFGDGQDPSIFPRATEMSRIMVPAQIAFLVGSVLLGVQYARKQFLAPALAPNVYNVAIILGAALLPGIFGFGIVGVAWGALAGAVIGNIVIPALMLWRSGASFRPSLDVRDPGVKKFFLLLLPVLFGFSLPSMATIITQKFASGFGEGANTVVSYANNLMQAPNGIFGQSLALAVFPVLAQFVAQNRMDLYRAQIGKSLRSVVYLSVPSSAILFALAPEIVHAIYGYGKASQQPGQLEAIATCLRIYCVGIFAWCLQPVLMRGFFSLHKTFKPIALSTGVTVLFVALCAALRGHEGGVYSLAWASNAAVLILLVLLYFSLEREVGKLGLGALATTFLKSLLGAGAMGAAAFGLMAGVHRLEAAMGGTVGRLAALAGLAFVCVVAAWVYFFVTRALKMEETEVLARGMNRFSRRRAGTE